MQLISVNFFKKCTSLFVFWTDDLNRARKQAFFARFSTTVTNSSCRNLEFFKKILEFFQKSLSFSKNSLSVFENS